MDGLLTHKTVYLPGNSYDKIIIILEVISYKIEEVINWQLVYKLVIWSVGDNIEKPDPTGR